MKFSSWYGISVGTLILLQWIVFLATGSVPELKSAPWEIGHHIGAELLLASMLLLGGIATLRSTRWGRTVLLVALGMAVYSEINSPGYFAQREQWALVGMFAVLLIAALWSIMILVKEGNYA